MSKARKSSEEKAAEIRDLTAKLEKGVTDLLESSNWTRWLSYQAAFHSYSFGNCMLISMQCPEATRVAGYKTWQKLGRQVRKGERGIRILAPMVGKTTNDDGEAVTFLRGFRAVSVFDVAQTDGEAAPSCATPVVGEDSEGRFGALVSVAESLGYTVSVGDAGRAHGFIEPATQRIVISGSTSPAQQAKTLAHELGHALLHTDGRSIVQDMQLDDAELEAESVAYIVCHARGLDSGSYSFGYLAHWKGQDSTAGLKRSAERIAGAAKRILEAIEETEAQADAA